MNTRIQIVRRDEAETLWVVRDRIRFMGEVGGSDLAVLEVEVPPGSGTPPHFHDSPELFRVLEGEIAFGLFDGDAPRERIAAADAVVTVPSRVPHSYRNAGSAPARMLVVVDSSMVRFFRELGRTDAPPAGPPDEAEIAAVLSACARHGITLLASTPA